jgi:hypothetical protein
MKVFIAVAAALGLFALVASAVPHNEVVSFSRDTWQQCLGCVADDCVGNCLSPCSSGDLEACATCVTGNCAACVGQCDELISKQRELASRDVCCNLCNCHACVSRDGRDTCCNLCNCHACAHKLPF